MLIVFYSESLILSLFYSESLLFWVSFYSESLFILSLFYSEYLSFWISLMLCVFNAECQQCWLFFMLSVFLCWVSFMLSVFYAESFLCWVFFMLSVVMLGVVMLGIIMLTPLERRYICWKLARFSSNTICLLSYETTLAISNTFLIWRKIITSFGLLGIFKIVCSGSLVCSSPRSHNMMFVDCHRNVKTIDNSE